MRLRRIGSSVKHVLNYLKDYRFSSILLKYFLMLLVCLVFPMIMLYIWYGNQLQENAQSEIFKRNELSLEIASESVKSIIRSTKNMAYSLAANEEMEFLVTRDDVRADKTGNLDNLTSMVSLMRSANEYIDSVYVYITKSEELITDQGVISLEKHPDKGWLEMYEESVPGRGVFKARKKNDQYPYLLTYIYPIGTKERMKQGAVIVNIDVEELGDYIGSGRYRNRDGSPIMLICDGAMETMIYSDEYLLLSEEESFRELKTVYQGKEEMSSRICSLWGEEYVVSGIYVPQEDFHYIYLSTMQQYGEQNRVTNARLRNVTVMIVVICFILAGLLAYWVYRPIQRTMRILEEMSMLTQWDKKEHVDEIEIIQRSILMAGEEKEGLNEQIKERIISLHNAQICALQTQINPHFLYNTLEAIGNTAALLMNEDNKVTDMIYTLGKLMRISLAGENYLVPLKEELEHVNLYIKLMDFRFRGRIRMHMEVPEELYMQRIVKLTLQPLIENAIEHGFAHMRNQGDIWLKGERRGEINYIYVIDNGKGISQEELIHLQEQLLNSAISSSSHIGLRNVNQRMKLIFGEDYGLQVNRAQEGGVCVTVCFRTL